jgi:hypothetical protein
MLSDALSPAAKRAEYMTVKHNTKLRIETSMVKSYNKYRPQSFWGNIEKYLSVSWRFAFSILSYRTTPKTGVSHE